MTDPFRVYLDPAEIGPDGYPYAWHGTRGIVAHPSEAIPIKDLVRERDGHRCLRCAHPYRKGEHGNGQWSPCDERCTHGGPTRTDSDDYPGSAASVRRWTEAEWRILTVHHLNGVKHDCRWFNLVTLCQRCHLSIQTRVVMDRPYDKPHSEWFRPFAAAFYAWKYLDQELTREEVDARLDELLALENTQDPIF